IVISNEGRGGRRYLPYAFTELGVSMLSSVLNSERAVQMNIIIMRTFVKLREMLANNAELARKIQKLEGREKDHAQLLTIVIKDIEQLARTTATEFRRLSAPRKAKARIGFLADPK